MSDTRLDLARNQIDLAWALFEHHLDRLVPDDLLWEPAPLCWTVRRDDAGTWVPDWSDTEPDPIPVPTIAWLTWQVGWWWSVTVDHLEGRPPRDRTAVEWPGDTAATVAWLRGLHDSYVAALARLDEPDLDRPAPFPWPPGSGRTVGDMVGWVVVELTKNAAEIGQLRLLRAAGRA